MYKDHHPMLQKDKKEDDKSSKKDKKEDTSSQGKVIGIKKK